MIGASERMGGERERGEAGATGPRTLRHGGTPVPEGLGAGLPLALLLLGLLLASSLTAPASLTAQAPAYPAGCSDPLDVPGRARSTQDGAPVAGASVVVPGLQLRVLTGDGGRFVLPGACPGPLELSVSHLAFGTTTLMATARRGEILDVRLDPRAIPLEGVLVSVEPVLRRLERRRMAVGQKSGVYDAADVELHELPTSIPAYVASRTGHPLQPCTGGALDRNACYPYRGGMAKVEIVCVDSAPIEGGLDVLELWPQDDIVRLEFYPGLGMMKVFTRSFMLQAAEHPWLLQGRLDHC